MSSVLDALTPEERAEVVETLQYRHLERMLIQPMLGRLVEAALVREIQIPNPGAGATTITTVPAGSIWEFLSLFCVLTTSATVGTRGFVLDVTDADSNFVNRYPSGGTMSAGAGQRFTWLAGLGVTSSSSFVQGVAPAPPIPLQAGWAIRTNVTGIDSGDVLSSIFLIVRDLSPHRVVDVVRRLLTDLDSAGGIRYLS